MRTLLIVAFLFSFRSECFSDSDGSATSRDVGDRRELFVDRELLDHFGGAAELKLHQPVSREIALRFDRPWEGNASGYPTVFQDGEIYRMYYRGHRYIVDPPPLRQAQGEVVCYAESRDGISWERPNLGLFDWPPTQNNSGNKQNNILWRGGPEAHNFAPFRDTNPACPAAERYKAVGGTVTSKGLLAFRSPDGIHWVPMSEKPVMSTGAFDSHNTVFWDAVHRRYSMYVRVISGGKVPGLRSVGMCHSADFQSWSEPVELTWPDSPPQQMYTNQIAPYYRAPHILFGFPTRYAARPLNVHGSRLEPLQLRQQLIAADERSGTDLTDGLFMTSRNGLDFYRRDEAFLRPGPQAEGRWVYGDNFQSYGLIETKSSVSGLPNEISMYFNEGSWRDEQHCLRRYTIRMDGFMSLHAPFAGGEVTSRPLKFTGTRLTLNYSTSAAGSVYVEIQDSEGIPLRGYSAAESVELYGDSPDQVVSWSGGSGLEGVSQPVRLRFIVKDADLYSFRFSE
jgi:hypothetical protein